MRSTLSVVLGLTLGAISCAAVQPIRETAQAAATSQTRVAATEAPPPSPQVVPEAFPDQAKDFVSRILGSTEDTWHRLFESIGRHYEEPALVLYSGVTTTGCGLGKSSRGPFYCPRDRRIYLDFAFFDTLARRYQAAGDFAQAYVIAHEVGHHVQLLFGIEDKAREIESKLDTVERNAFSVRMELQADCLAGIWAHFVEQQLEAGDIEEALNAASQIGDDMMQKRATGEIVPDNFTHGSAAQRVRWFKRGYEAGQMQVCDTFDASEL